MNGFQYDYDGTIYNQRFLLDTRLDIFSLKKSLDILIARKRIYYTPNGFQFEYEGSIL
jgi:hypothetical protein